MQMSVIASVFTEALRAALSTALHFNYLHYFLKLVEEKRGRKKRVRSVVRQSEELEHSPKHNIGKQTIISSLKAPRKDGGGEGPFGRPCLRLASKPSELASTTALGGPHNSASIIILHRDPRSAPSRAPRAGWIYTCAWLAVGFLFPLLAPQRQMIIQVRNMSDGRSMVCGWW